MMSKKISTKKKHQKITGTGSCLEFIYDNLGWHAPSTLQNPLPPRVLARLFANLQIPPAAE